MSDDKKASEKPRRRMTPAQWAEARAMWASGEFTAEQIAEKFGVARETLSRRFKKDGVKKGQSAIDKRVEAEIIEKATKNVDKWAERAEQARESFYKTYEMLHKMTVKTIGDAHRGAGLFSAQPDLKALQMAASVMDRVRLNQWAVIGLDKESADEEEIPELLIRELTPDEVQRLKTMQNSVKDEEIEVGEADPYLEDLDDEDVDTLIVEEGDT